MDVETIRDYCLNKPATTEGLPFGNDTLVLKVAGKIFLLFSLDLGNRFNAKCDPELAVELRDKHPEVIPGYHMNKQQWNSVYIDGNLTDRQIKEMMDHSYDLIVAKLPKKVKDEFSLPQ